MTNADKIRAMTDEEFAAIMVSFDDCAECPIRNFCRPTKDDLSCFDVALLWLKQEVSDNG